MGVPYASWSEDFEVGARRLDDRGTSRGDHDGGVLGQLRAVERGSIPVHGSIRTTVNVPSGGEPCPCGQLSAAEPMMSGLGVD